MNGAADWVLQRHGAPLSSLATSCLWERSVELQMRGWFDCARSAGMDLGMGIVLLSRQRVVARLGPLGRAHSQPMGLLHGGVSALIAEELGSIAASINSNPHAVVGVNVSATHLASARMGQSVIAVASPLKVGARLQVWNIDLYIDEDPADVLATLGVATAADGSIVDQRALYYRDHKPKGKHLATCQLTAVAQDKPAKSSQQPQKQKAVLPSKL